MLKLIFIFLIVNLNVKIFPLCPPELQEDPYKPFADVMPEPVGGLESLYKTINYPDLAKKSGVQGKVYLLIYINETGGVDDVKVIKGIGAGCDEAAVDAVKKASFTPGKVNGAPVKTKLSLPVIFKMK
ncbi:MAG TPA: energy transducer TonB [Ignavibacteriaceae bacterium]|nr:energy transducer TonB [Ignavibacteriaceae bacterium]